MSSFNIDTVNNRWYIALEMSAQERRTRVEDLKEVRGYRLRQGIHRVTFFMGSPEDYGENYTSAVEEIDAFKETNPEWEDLIQETDAIFGKHGFLRVEPLRR